MSRHGRVFVSYRRDDVPGDARSIRDRLSRKFGERNVFMDVDNLLAGQRFDRELDNALKQCDVLVAVIGPQWMKLLSEKTNSGERDYVRDEIAAALKRDIVVIPALVGREGHMPALPRQADLPEDIRDLVQYQKHSIVHESFGRNVDDLTAAIEMVRRGGDAPRRWMPLVAGAAALLAFVAVGAWFFIGWPEMRTQPAAGPAASKSAADVAARADAELAAKKAAEQEARKKADDDARRAAEQEARKKADDDARRAAEQEARKKADDDARRAAEQEARKKADEGAKRAAEAKAARDAAAECDRLAASYWDNTRPIGVPGVNPDKLDAEAAWPVCNNAMRLNPDVPRLIYQAGRSALARKDFANATELLRKAGSLGSAVAFDMLGDMLLDGDGVEKNEVEAKKWFEKAAGLGLPGAMTRLGYMYHNGQGVTRDLVEARKFYERAAALGDSRAMTNLGVMAHSGDGMVQNYAEAKKWYEKAIGLNEEAAMYRLGILYEYGLGVPKNIKVAREWYRKAVDYGDVSAKSALERLK